MAMRCTRGPLITSPLLVHATSTASSTSFGTPSAAFLGRYEAAPDACVSLKEAVGAHEGFLAPLCGSAVRCDGENYWDCGLDNASVPLQTEVEERRRIKREEKEARAREKAEAEAAAAAAAVVGVSAE